MAARDDDDVGNARRLLDLWTPNSGFGAPIGCVATTFTFDAAHFEEQCLARFLGMESDPAERERAYLIEREEKLSESFACVIGDRRHAAEQRSLRWHLLSAAIPGGAIQHSKLSFLLWEKHLRILISSANLTEPGYRRNREVMATFDFEPDGGAPIDLATQCLDHLERLQELVPGSMTKVGPKGRLSDFTNRARRHLALWNSATPDSTEVRVRVISLLPGDPRGRSSVVSQLGEFWQGSAPNIAMVVSPFFDVTDSAVDRVYEHFVALLTTRGERSIQFVAPGRVRADGSAEVDVPERLVRAPAKHPSMDHLIAYVDEQGTGAGDQTARALHAKLVLLERDQNAVLMLGSSNFTLAGLGLITGHNAELNVAYRIPPSASKFYKGSLAALPPRIELDDGATISFIQTSDVSNDDPGSSALLPSGFVEALFVPDEAGGSVELCLIPEELPSQFSLFARGNAPVLNNLDWNAGYSSAPRVLVRVERPLSGLRVKWTDSEGAEQYAIWPVNVSDSSLLPPPAELRNLDLNDLLLVLTSARPAYRVLAELADRKSDRIGKGLVVDPHKKVDTSAFLLRRMRRLAHALEGLRERLERPVASREAIHWRLFGPLGPVALATLLREESGTGHPFFIAEVAGTLREIRWQVGAMFDRSEATAEVDDAIATLQALVLGEVESMPENLREYVMAQFPGAQS